MVKSLREPSPWPRGDIRWAVWDSCEILRIHDGHCPLVIICNGLASKGYVIGYVGGKNNLSLDEVKYVAFGYVHGRLDRF